ncbi:hypothetical protein [Sphingopyxis sp. JAI128]|uniref:hypothetical protein n=1 Tax=Sphingopyxis sp. JAI128 TaxID=2723066 RepID=UPI00160AEBF8|nr:hypothetical protein [Sphingopyxis sp. JAI128]MBB6425883.1 hypothetical protein [Sphingopyxis sp. JAI128]
MSTEANTPDRELMERVQTIPNAASSLQAAFAEMEIGTAIDQLNNLVTHYSTELRRVEGVFVALLLPAAVALIVAQVRPADVDPARAGLIGFFAVYAILIFVDLWSAERRLSHARDLRSVLFHYRNDTGVEHLKTVAARADDAVFAARYAYVQTCAERPYLLGARIKPVVGLAGAFLIWLIVRGGGV